MSALNVLVIHQIIFVQSYFEYTVTVNRIKTREEENCNDGDCVHHEYVYISFFYKVSRFNNYLLNEYMNEFCYPDLHEAAAFTGSEL